MTYTIVTIQPVVWLFSFGVSGIKQDMFGVPAFVQEIPFTEVKGKMGGPMDVMSQVTYVLDDMS